VVRHYLPAPRGGAPAKPEYTRILSVRIANPSWGGSSYTTTAQAQRFAAQGIGKYLADGSIYLHEQLRSDRLREATRGMGGYARFDELKHVPVLMAHKLFTLDKRPRATTHRMRGVRLPHAGQERALPGAST